MAHTSFPSDLPVPVDDGLCNHLTNAKVPSISLPVARDPSQSVDLSALPGLTVVFCYPRTGAPDEVVPEDWNSIPGARGCTPQACGFRDNFSKLQSLGVSQVFGVSTQSPAYQDEVRQRVHLPYDLLSDEKLEFQKSLELPTIDWQGKALIKRLCLAVEKGAIQKWWYPVFPPDKNVDDVLAWLQERQTKE